jgi:hypothetical protein
VWLLNKQQEIDIKKEQKAAQRLTAIKRERKKRNREIKERQKEACARKGRKLVQKF